LLSAVSSSWILPDSPTCGERFFAHIAYYSILARLGANQRRRRPVPRRAQEISRTRGARFPRA
jgi:hypothetical protein